MKNVVVLYFFALLRTHFEYVYGHTNVSTVHEEHHDKLLTSLVTRIASKLPQCTLVLSTDRPYFAPSLLELARSYHYHYQFVVATQMVTFPFTWKDYWGLTK